MANRYYVVCDTETSGLSTSRDRIVSIAASSLEDGNTFSEFVRPGVPIPPACTRVHGIHDKDVAQCDTWGCVGKRFWEWASSVSAGRRLVLIAHNGARFDFPLIMAENERHGITGIVPAHSTVDTLVICRAELGLKSNRLALVYAHLFGEEFENQHSADADVGALRRICAHERIRPHLDGPRALELLRAAAADPKKKKKGATKCSKCGRVVSPHFLHTEEQCTRPPPSDSVG